MSIGRVNVVGLGFVGLPIAAILAASGKTVRGVDSDPEVLRRVASGNVATHEIGLGAAVAKACDAGRLIVSAMPDFADAFVLAVATPIRGLAHKTADLSFVIAAARSVAPFLRRGNLVVIESTCPPGTTTGIVRSALEDGSGLRCGQDFSLAYCPERVLPGRILEELVQNDRIVGGVDAASGQAAVELYSSFVRGQILVTDAATAELVKLMENTYRDVNIALANEFALVAQHLGIDVWEAIDLANHHPRVQFARPGPGVGGHCIAVDPWFIVGAAPRFTSLIVAGRGINDAMPMHVADLAADALGDVSGKRLVALGITYKADVDDVRESPAVEVIECLRRMGAEVRVHDAMVASDKTVEELADGADCLLILVDHLPYTSLDPASLAQVMRQRVVIDTRGVLQAQKWEAAGFVTRLLGVGKRVLVDDGLSAVLSASRRPA